MSLLVAVVVLVLAGTALPPLRAGAVAEPTGPVRLSVSDGVVVEPDRGARTAKLVLTLSAPLEDDLVVRYRTVDGTAEAGTDYRAKEARARIPAGRTSRPIGVRLSADADTEPLREGFTVQLSATDGPAVVFDKAVGEVTIVDDGPPDPERVVLRGGSATVVEGDRGTATVPVQLALSAPLPHDLPVALSTGRTVTIKAGRTSRYVAVPVLADLVPDGALPETFTVTLATTDASVAVVEPIRVQVVDDDAPPPPPTTVPGAPTSVSVTPLPVFRLYALSWEAPVDDGGAPISDYRVRAVVDGVVAADTGTGGARSIDVVCPPDSACRWEIRAVNGAGVGPAATTTLVGPLPAFEPPCGRCG